MTTPFSPPAELRETLEDEAIHAAGAMPITHDGCANIVVQASGRRLFILHLERVHHNSSFRQGRLIQRLKRGLGLFLDP